MATNLRASVLSNAAGNGVSALATVISVPLVVHFLGVEQYGLVGFYASLQGVIAVLDAGLNATLNRTLAGLSVRSDSEQDMRDTVRTLESFYWGGSAVLCLALVGLSRFAQDWFGQSNVSAATVQTAVMMMGLAVALQFPFALYTGGLLGMRRQIQQNVIAVTFVLLKTVGSILILWLVSPTIEAYLLWQIITNAAQSVATGGFLWSILPRAPRPSKPSLARFRGLSGFATGMWTVNLGFITLVQGPRFLVSRMLGLKEFGYYTVAFVAATGMYFLATPVVSAVFPRFTQMVELGQEETLRALYHKATQLMSVLALPLAAVLAFLAPQVLLAWTGNLAVVQGSSKILSLLVAGTALHQLFSVPQVLQFAHGWTKLSASLNWIGILVLLPLTIWMTSAFGASGAALSWVIMTGGYLTIGVALMHRRLLRGEARRWYLNDVAPAAAVTVAVCLILRLTLPGTHERLVAAAEVLLCYGVAALAAMLALPGPRGWLREALASTSRLHVRSVSAGRADVPDPAIDPYEGR